MTPSEIEEHFHLWPGMQGAEATLINFSENHTFRVDHADGRKEILRVHRPGYNDKPEIASELMWIEALQKDAALRVPVTICGNNGEAIQTVRDQAGRERFAVMFRFEEGVEPLETDDLTSSFRQLGALAARCHNHAETWVIPSGFHRMTWDAATILPPGGLWGDWRVAPGVDGPIRRLLERLCARLSESLGAYGKSRDRFGIIHADMRLANLLIDHGTVKLIDFDDCGFGWYMYDFAAAVSFMETSERVPELAAHWSAGYDEHRALGAEDREMVGAMIMLRRMALLAWSGSHGETDLARSLHAHFADGTASLAGRYLSGQFMTA